MIVNLIVIALILFIGQVFTEVYKSNSNAASVRKKYIGIICFILILQSGLRNVAVGADTYSYYLWFEEIKTTSWKMVCQSFLDYYQLGVGKDPGYDVFLKLIQIVTDKYQIFLLMIAILFFTTLGNFIYKNTTRLSDAILAFVIYAVLFYSFFSITGTRQTIATAATLFGYELIKRKKVVPFLIVILLASTIHKSSLIFIPFYFIARIKNPKYLYRIVLVLFPLFMIFKNNMGDYLKVLGGYEEYDQLKDTGTYTFTAMFLLISIVALWRSKIILKFNANSQYYYNAFAIALLFIPLTWINPNAMRIVQYFSIFMLLFIPEIIFSFQVVSQKLRRDLSRVTIILLILLFIRASLSNEIPYGFFWEEMRLGNNYFIND
jgi:hypothetical protein